MKTGKKAFLKPKKAKSKNQTIEKVPFAPIPVEKFIKTSR